MQVLWPASVFVLWLSGLCHYVIWKVGATILWGFDYFIFRGHSADRRRMYSPKRWCAFSAFPVSQPCSQNWKIFIFTWTVRAASLFSKTMICGMQQRFLGRVVLDVVTDCSVFTFRTSSKRKPLFMCSLTLNTKVVWFFKLGTTHKMMNLHIAKNFNLQGHRCEKSQVICVNFAVVSVYVTFTF